MEARSPTAGLFSKPEVAGVHCQRNYNSTFATDEFCESESNIKNGVVTFQVSQSNLSLDVWYKNKIDSEKKLNLSGSLKGVALDFIQRAYFDIIPPG